MLALRSYPHISRLFLTGDTARLEAELKKHNCNDARIENMALGAKAKLFFRRAGDEAYSSVDFVRARGTKDRYQTTLPAYELPSEANPYEVEYYFEVADVDGLEKTIRWYKTARKRNLRQREIIPSPLAGEG